MGTIPGHDVCRFVPGECTTRIGEDLTNSPARADDPRRRKAGAVSLRACGCSSGIRRIPPRLVRGDVRIGFTGRGKLVEPIRDFDDSLIESCGLRNPQADRLGAVRFSPSAHRSSTGSLEDACWRGVAD